ncbi:MAG: hypothetical protein GY696_12760, partial [Gammaproteobacteria bacterium]|nr:hypothetical protein [Gammaproteobacteria bacterium]
RFGDYDFTSAPIGRPLLSSTRESLIDKFDDCEEFIQNTTAIRLLVNCASDSESSEVFVAASDVTVADDRRATQSVATPSDTDQHPTPSDTVRTAANQPTPSVKSTSDADQQPIPAGASPPDTDQHLTRSDATRTALNQLSPPLESTPTGSQRPTQPDTTPSNAGQHLTAPDAARIVTNQTSPSSAALSAVIQQPTPSATLPFGAAPIVKPRTVFNPTPSPRPESTQTYTSLSKSVEIVLPSSTENSLDLVGYTAESDMMMEVVDRYLRAQMAWNDDYDDVDLSQVPLNGINQLVEKAIQYKDDLAEVYIKLRNATPDQIVEIGSKESVLELKDKFIQFKKRGWAKVSHMSGSEKTEQSRPGTAVSQMSAATEEIVTARVNSRKPKLLDQA